MTKKKEKKEDEMTDIFEPSGVSLDDTEKKENPENINNVGKAFETPTNQEAESSKDVVQEYEQVNEKIKQLENQYIRIMADYQNLQKRAAQEKEDLYKYASKKTIESLLPALDTFEYARSALTPESKIEKTIEDLNLVYETLLKCLKEIGIEMIEETGIPFNPVYHEPLHQIPTNELPDHTVMQVLKKGYILNGKVIRPALVSVSVKQGEK